MNKNPLLKKFGKQKRFVTWRKVTRGDKTTKVPYSLSGKMASSTDEKTWHTAEEILSAKKPLGIVFDPDQKILGIDIDHCIEGTEITHAEKQKIAQLIIESDTYTEISPSGNGLHLYFALTGPLVLEANRHDNFEAYTSGRYFTVTGTPYKESNPVRTVTPAEALELLAIIGYPWGKEQANDMPKTDISIPHVEPIDILKKMFASANGEKIKAIYENDAAALSAYGKDASKADMALLAHLAFWTKRDAALMEEIWLASPIGQREKTQTRKDYRDRSIASAIKNCKEVYESREEKMSKEAPELELLYHVGKDKEKIFIQNTENIRRILSKHPAFAGKLRFDRFKNALEIAYPNPKQVEILWRDLEDNDQVVIQTRIQVIFPCFSKVGKDMVYDAMVAVARENSIDSAMDYVSKLVWDEVPRLDEWLTSAYHTPSDIYHRAVAANWFKGLVKRICLPGCKFDYVLVLEGEQGIKKSTSLAIIGSPFSGANWHVETSMSTESKDFFMQMSGKAIVEFSEGETLNRTEVKRMKAIITTQSDKYRPSYGRLSVDFPRRCVFAMTTNQSEYLKDETGNRRWLPVACDGMVDIKWLEENIAQLYAEAYHRVITRRETVHEFPEEETRAAQSNRRIHDPNEDLIADWYFNKLKQSDRDEGITIHQVYRDAICGGMIGKPLNRFDEMAIADVLRSVLRLDKRRKMLPGTKQSTRWFHDQKSMQSAELLPLTDLERF